MSFKAVAWAWEQRGLTPSQRIVLIGLAQHADKSGDCFPRVSVLADECELSQRAIELATKDLADRGIITVTKRERADKSLTSNLYHLNIYAVFAVGGEQDSPPPSEQDSPLGDEDSPPYKESESAIEPVKLEPITEKRRDAPVPAEFAEFHEIVFGIYQSNRSTVYRADAAFWGAVRSWADKGVDVTHVAQQFAAKYDGYRYKNLKKAVLNWLSQEADRIQRQQSQVRELSAARNGSYGRNGTNTADNQRLTGGSGVRTRLLEEWARQHPN